MMIKVKSILSCTDNTRYLGGYKGKNNVFIRSDALISLSEEDVVFLLDNGISTIVDLRSDDEVKNEPCDCKINENFKYYHCRIYGNGRIPKDAESVPISYFNMINDKKTILEVMKVLVNVEGGVLYYCTAGKDRTGIISALLLLLAGVSRNDIVADYEISQEYLCNLLKLFSENNKNVDINIVTPKPEHMNKFLDMFFNKYNSIEEYLFEIGLSNEEISKLKNKLISFMKGEIL
ncbi:tyrosine-protein phosphatase [uncultured Clostridium sp.]|uniref:tyrosine-protein phosphatase n=1 Tax=uncultured Clostridium sp. TaxID=59620 RepID=UPI0026014433|nr:tyrosine-protein phosphatase [uncultured Clostridium sp.]